MTDTQTPLLSGGVGEDQGGPVRARRRGRRLVLVVVLAASAAAVWRVAGDGGAARPEGDQASVRTGTATVERRVLRQTVTEDGRLGYKSPTTLVTREGGVVTSIPPAGSVVDRGGVLFTVDRRPVVLLLGAVPAYRDLYAGLAGPDVRQLEENLVALGHGRGVTVDDEYTSATAAAVRRWQASLGQEPTGVVDAASVVFRPEPVRMGAHKARVGASVEANAEIAEAASNAKVVTVQLDARRASGIEPGDKADLELPDGTRTTGTVASVGTVATKADEDSDPTIDVTIALDDPGVAGDLDQAPVDVDIALESTEALAVPVTALVALREGGYALEVVEGAATRFVPVEIGTFADGFVEVKGPEVRAGMTVVVPR